MPVINIQNWATSGVPIPDLTGLLHLYSTFGIVAGWQNGSPIIRDGDDNGKPSTASAPYPLDWAIIGTPLLRTWSNQASALTDDADGVGHEPDINVGAETFTYNGTTQYLATASSAISSMNQLTMYCVFKMTELAHAHTLFQYHYDTDYVTTADGLFAAYLTAAGVLTVTQKKDDVVDVFNTQIKTLGDTNLHLLTVVFDRTVAAANQTLAKIDNSTSGWSSAVAGDMASVNFGNAQSIGLGLGQPLGLDAFLVGVMPEFWLFDGAHDTSRQTSVYNWMKYTHPTIG